MLELALQKKVIKTELSAFVMGIVNAIMSAKKKNCAG